MYSSCRSRTVGDQLLGEFGLCRIIISFVLQYWYLPLQDLDVCLQVLDLMNAQLPALTIYLPASLSLLS